LVNQTEAVAVDRFIVVVTDLATDEIDAYGSLSLPPMPLPLRIMSGLEWVHDDGVGDGADGAGV